MLNSLCKSVVELCSNTAKKTILFVLTALLVIQMAPIQSFANPLTEPSKTSDQIIPLANDIAELGDVLDSRVVGLYADPYSYGDSPLSNNATVGKNDAFWFVLNFQETGGTSHANAIVEGAANGTKFTISTWPGILVSEISPAGVPLTVMEEGNAEQFGMLYYDDPETAGGPNKVPYVIFTDAYWQHFGSGALMTDGHIGFKCTLDGTSVGTNESVQIDIPYGSSLTLGIRENQPVDPTISKAATLDSEKMQLNWTVTYTVGSDASTAPVFVDSFPNDTHFYLASSFEVDGQPQTPLVSDGGTETTLTYDLTNALSSLSLGDTIIISYSTVVCDEELAPGSGESNIFNKAQIKASESSNTPVSEASVTQKIPADSKAWLRKTGEEDPANRKIKWTVILSTMDRNLDNLVMYDHLQEGLTLDASSIQINGNALTPPVATYEAITTDPFGKDASFKLTFAEPYIDTYEITYETTVADSFFNEVHAETLTFNNEAWLDYTWKKYQGTDPVEFTYEHPTIGKGVAVHTSVINKAVNTAYDPATQMITWQVTVNPHGVDMQNGTITDPMPKNGDGDYILEYVSGSFQSDSAFVTENGGTTKDQLLIDVGTLGTSSATYTYRTKVIDKNFTSYNTIKKPIVNEAVFNGTIAVGGINNTISDDKTTATDLVSSAVLSKAGTFAHNANGLDNVVTWKILVNANAMSEGFDQATLVDTIEEGQRYVDGSVAISAGGSSVPIDPSKITYLDNTLTVDLENKAEGTTLEVSYLTTVDADKVAGFKTDQSVALGNHVDLKRDSSQYRDESVDATVSVSNKLSAKTGTLKTDDGKYLEYTVNLNPYKLDLQGVTISDTLPVGLSLNIDSLSLCVADVSASGSFIPTAATYPLEALDFKFTPGDESNGGAFELTLPAGKQAYQLVYQCDIVELKDSYANSFGFLSGGFDSGVGESTHTYNGSGLGGAVSSRTAQIAIKKESSDKNIPLEGVVFGLFRDVAGVKTQVAIVKTDHEGKAVFAGLAKNIDYIIEETTPLPGYSNPIIVFSDTTEMPLDDYVFNAATPGKTELTIQNDPAQSRVEFTKVNDWGQTLSGVEFSLYEAADTTTPIAVVSSDANGKVIFEDVAFGNYLLRETAVAVANHEINTAWYSVEVAIDGSVKITDAQSGVDLANNEFVNEAWTVPVEILAFEDATKDPLENMEFTVIDEQGRTLFTGRTNAVGSLSFRLPAGQTFTVIETPDGKWQPTEDKKIETPSLSSKDEAVETLSVLWPKANAPVFEENGGTGSTDGQNGTSTKDSSNTSSTDKPSKEKSLSSTGDSINLLILAALASVSLLVMLGALYTNRRLQKKRK